MNHPARRRLAFGALACSLLTLIPLGIAVRRSNYINAELGDVANGGLQLNASGRNGSIVLMGDSHASMYAKALAEVARERGMRLTVISVAAGDPLPRSIGAQPELWLHSLAVVRHERPDVLILACKWMDKLEGDKRRLHLALDQLVPSARAVVMITQPPVLPEGASREGIREGKRPPFREDQATRAKRQEMNRWVRSFGRDKIRVIDIEPLFSTPAGNVRFDDTGRLLYQDLDHLSVAGARLACKQLL